MNPTNNQPPGSVAPGDMPSAYGQQAINIPMAPTPTLPQLLNQQAQQELAAAQRAKLNPADNQAPGSTAPGQQSAAAMAAQMPRAAQPNVMPGVGFNPQAAQGMFPLVQGGQPMFMNLTQGGQPMFATLPAPNYSEYFARIQAAQMGAYGQPSQGASQLPQPSTMPTVAAAGRGKPAAPGAAMQPQVASVPAPLPPRPPSLPNLPETARATAQALEDERAAARKAAADAVARSFPSITRPQTREDQEVLPLPRLQALVKETCGPAVELTPDSESALKALAEDFVCGAVEFAVDMAKKKKARKLDPADLALYFMRTWDVNVPGLSQGSVLPYRRIAPSEAHRARTAAVRKANMALGKAAAATAKPPGTAEAGPSAAPASAAAARPSSAAEPQGKAASAPAGGRQAGGGAQNGANGARDLGKKGTKRQASDDGDESGDDDMPDI